MRKLAMLLATTTIMACAATHKLQPAPLQLARQLVIVRSSDWGATKAELRRYQRAKEGHWTEVGKGVPVMLGKSGLGWGRGLHGEPPGEPVKREGDGRAPAGVFALGPAFGASDSPPAGVRFAYVAETSTLECVDDGKSRHYNELVDGAKVKRDWDSSEHMRRKDELYDVGLFVLHNSPQPRAGAGSCIFLHVWKGPGQPTVGCTSMALLALTDLLAWLDPAASPVLVQLPAVEYDRLREAWGIPGD